MLLISSTLDSGTSYDTKAIKVTDLLPIVDEDDFTSDSATAVPTQQSVKAYVDTKISDLIGTAPAVLDTLQELSAALGGDENFATTITTSISNLDGLVGAGAAASDLGTFTGSQIPDASTVKEALQSLEDGLASAVSGGILSGSNVNQLVADTTAPETDPDNWMFLIVDTADGSIKVLNKTFLELE